MKQRIIGAVVLVSLAVIFIPMLLDGNRQYERVIVKTNIPPKPRSFNSKIIPLDLEKPASTDTTTTTTPPAPTVSPHIKPLKQATPTVAKKPEAVSSDTKTASKTTIKAVSKPVASKPTEARPAASTVTKTTAKPVSRAAENEDSATVTAIDKSTRLARVEPVVSGQPLTGGSGASAGAPVADSSGKSPRTGVAAWAVQVGSFEQEANANTLRDRLRKRGYASFVERIYGKSAVSYRVRVGPELDRKTADALRDKLASREKLNGLVVHYP